MCGGIGGNARGWDTRMKSRNTRTATDLHDLARWLANASENGTAIGLAATLWVWTDKHSAAIHLDTEMTKRLLSVLTKADSPRESNGGAAQSIAARHPFV